MGSIYEEGWQDVTESLPPLFKPVIVGRAGASYSFEAYRTTTSDNEQNWYWTTALLAGMPVEPLEYLGNITHWRHFPIPPKVNAVNTAE